MLLINEQPEKGKPISTPSDSKAPHALHVPLSKVPLAARTIWSAIALVLE